MKFSILKITIAAGLAGLQLKFMPNVNMLGWVFVAVFVDFITGVIKAKIQDKLLSSQGFRQTSIKCLQYLGLIVGCIILGNTVDKENQLVKWINDGMLLFIIYVEVYSIFENLYAFNPDSKVAPLFKLVMRILTVGLEKNNINKIVEDVESAAKTDAVKTLLIVTSILALTACKVVKPGTDTSYTKEDTTITAYKPVNAEYKGATVGNSINQDSLFKAFAALLQKSNSNGQRPINIDSLLTAFKAGLKQGQKDTMLVTDPQSKVQLKYWYDEFGKLQMTCSSKDQTIQLMVAEITRLTKEVSKAKSVEVIYKMPWWGWLIVGVALVSFLGVVIVFFAVLKDRR